MTAMEIIKEEIRNKRGELLAGILAAGFSLAIAQISSLAGLCMLLAVGACGLLGIKDWSSGRKPVGSLFGIFAVVLFFLVAGITLAGPECRQEAATEAAMEVCREIDVTAQTHIRRLSGITLLLLFANPLLGCFFRQRLHTPSKFAAEFGEQEPSKVAKRWFSKEKGFETFVLEELGDAGIADRLRYEWVCDVRGVAPERYDSGARYDWKARDLLADAPWQSVYDLVERCWPVLGFLHKEHFERRVNEYLREEQVGWVFANGKWSRVGDEIGEENLQKAAEACEEVGAPDARIDIMNAWKLCNELGEGYEKDAVVAATRALERIVQDRTNQPSTNLNRIKWQGPNIPHEKLRGVINTLYSYSSEQARHAHEEASITAGDAHLVVSISAILIVYLTEKHPRSAGEESIMSDDSQDEGIEPE
ncbi:MAG: hypothetical protein OXF79_15215 [Chloroflexi bacterium]|nr:hypothetical protein [Chloroflexota bacterium]